MWLLMGKDQEEEAGILWALLKGRWRPSGEEDAAGMSARTEIKVSGKEMEAEQHQRGNSTPELSKSLCTHSGRDTSGWHWMTYLNGYDKS